MSALIADANWAGANACFTSEIQKLGWDGTIVAPPNETASNTDMVNLTEEAIGQKPDGIVVVPLVAAAFDNVLAKAKAANIPVVALGLDTSTPDQRVALVWSDNTLYGQQAADEVGKLANGKGNVGILYSSPATSNQVTSIASFTKELAAKFPDMKIIGQPTILEPGGDRSIANAAERARGMLLAHPEINVIWGPDGYSGIAGALAAKAVGKKPGDMVIVGADHLPQVKADLQSGWETASLAFVSCHWGTGVVDAFQAYFNGTLPNPPVYVEPAVLYTHENP